ncbi:MAG: efflux RND transporter periplasmic adaptor subunit [Planctomycetota bacterium]|nr:efflux RND transporter periplasmic adaptor subunit [Planctomycetota bacterium]
MIDLSNIKAPGWQRLVLELSSPASDDRQYLARLVASLGQVSAARQAVFFHVPRSTDEAASPMIEARALMLWPAGTGASAGSVSLEPAAGTIEHELEARSAARTAANTRNVGVFGLDREDGLYDGGQGKGYLIAVPVFDGLPQQAGNPELRGVVTLFLDQRSRQAVQATLAIVELVAGYVYTHALGQLLNKSRQASAALDLATRLIASINGANSFKGAAIQLVNDLARQVAAERVALGWISGGKRPRGSIRSRVIALSDTEHMDRRMAMAQKIEAAMDECLDQEQAILYPAPPTQGDQADYVLSQAIVHSHRELAARDATAKVASIPVRAEGRVVGVVTIEATSVGHIDVGSIELLQATLDLVGPVLEIRRSDDRNLALRTYDWGLKTAGWLVGPKNTLSKVVGLVVFVALMLAIFVKVPYRVGSPMTIDPRHPRNISMPFDGVIESLGEGVDAGASVKTGQLLVQLDTTDLRLRALDTESEILQYQKQADEARKKPDGQSETQQYEARVRQAEAKLALLRTRIEQATITSPIDGTIIAGDLKDKVKAAVELGTPLMRVADVRDMLVIAQVDDRDIRFLKPGTTGQVTLKAEPAREYAFTVETIVPLSQAKEGRNVFEIRCTLHNPPGYLRPGMEGRAKFDIDKRSVASIASRRIVDVARLWIWW